MSFQPGANLYTQGFGSRPEGVEVPHIEKRDPAPTDVNYPIGKRWLNTASEEEFILFKFQVVGGVTQAVWSTPVGSTGAVISISDGENPTVKTFPDGQGNIQLIPIPGQTFITSSVSRNQMQIGLTNPLLVDGFNSAGPVNLAVANNQAINIGNSASLSQAVNIQSSSAINIGTLGTAGSITVGEANHDLLINSFATYAAGVKTQGNLSNPSFGYTVLNATFAVDASFIVVGPANLNCTGAEGVIRCDSSAGVISIVLSNNAVNGAFVYVYDATGSAGASNISVSAPPGGSIFVSGAAAAPSYIISVNYGNLILYKIPNTPNYIVFNK